MKSKLIILALVLSLAFLAGCNKAATPNQNAKATPSAKASPSASVTPDTVTTASVVDNNAAFEKAISDKGTWIICTLKDLTFDKDLVLQGEFKNGKKDANGKDIIQRKIGLYTQDANRNITNRFTLTAPKLTINSPEASIQHGTFKGDLYVSVKNFKLVDATVEGNVYFTTDEAKSTFAKDETSKVTGKQEIKK